MAGGAYNELKGYIDVLDLSAKKAGKAVTFEDARVLTQGMEDVTPYFENLLSSKILVTVKDKLFGDAPKRVLVDRFEKPEVPFMKKIFRIVRLKMLI